MFSLYFSENLSTESYLVLGGVEANLQAGPFEYLPLSGGSYWGTPIATFGFSGSVNGKT